MVESNLAQLFLIWGAVLLAAVLRAFTGFGFALAAIPVFAVFLPPTQAVVLSVLLTLSISLLRVRTYWGVVPVRPLLPLLLMSLLGTAAGATLLAYVSARQFQLWAGMSVILACLALTFMRPSGRWSSPWFTGFTGLFSGLMNGALAIPGPPMIIYAMLTEPEPLRSRALLMTFFLASSLLALGSYWLAGFIEIQSLWYFLLAFPALYAGDRLGYTLFHRFGDTFYRRIALACLLGLGVTTTLHAML